MNALTPRPAYLSNPAANLGATLTAGLSQPMPNRISLKDDRFTLLMESGQVHPSVPPALQLQVIFVGGNPHASRVYYDADDAYDPDNANVPVCWSDNGVGPSDKVSSPVSPTCASCPNSAWTKITAMGSKVPPCMTRKKCAVLVAGAGDTVFLLDIPPGSLKPFSQYMAKLGSELHASPEEVVTVLTMTNKQLSFEAGAWLPEAMLPAVAQVVASSAPDDVVNAHDRPHQARLTAPQQFTNQTPIPQSLPVTGARADPFALMYPKPPAHESIPETFAPRPEYDERYPPPMTANEAEAHTRKPRADKGQPRKPRETVVGPGPIAPATFIQRGLNPPQPDLNPAPQLSPASQFGMAPATPPPLDMNDMLTKAFGLRTGK